MDTPEKAAEGASKMRLIVALNREAVSTLFWEPDTIMKSKFFSIFFHRVPGAIGRLGGGYSSKTRPFLAKEREQAEVGQSPTLLALRFATGGLRILRGYFRAFLPMKEKKTGYLGVSCIHR
ncbi:hypothetical protein [Mucilaginibacter sp. UYCu711]|uniref:hypothetical protein n=1 Tax=Mucilaginibacter sp. UYCu711 TaxID=3156339 RepID=UPI003D263A07